ncbi:MAG: hypothetical protein MI867_30095 [Pseudomonadales bacterium]|nr:hypothetical protein [Pseudomonadales bacterium]
MFKVFKKKNDIWPFDQPRNCAVFTIRQIIEGTAPIDIVYHDLEDNGWQFLSKIDYVTEDARIVGLEEITELDPSIFEVARIEPGCHASRANKSAKWVITKTLDDDS